MDNTLLKERKYILQCMKTLKLKYNNFWYFRLVAHFSYHVLYGRRKNRDVTLCFSKFLQRLILCSTVYINRMEYCVVRITRISKNAKMRADIPRDGIQYLLGSRRYLLVAEAHEIEGDTLYVSQECNIHSQFLSYTYSRLYIRVAYIQDGTKPG